MYVYPGLHSDEQPYLYHGPPCKTVFHEVKATGMVILRCFHNRHFATIKPLMKKARQHLHKMRELNRVEADQGQAAIPIQIALDKARGYRND